MEVIIQPYPFTPNPAPIEQIANSAMMQLCGKINDGEKLTRLEKNRLIGIDHRFMGWYFPFINVERRFLVKMWGNWYEEYAYDKTAIYNKHGRHNIEEIYEIPKK